MKFLNNKRITILASMGFLLLAFFTILFLKFYSDNYGVISNEEEEILEEALINEEKSEEYELPSVNYDNMTSVFDRDLPKKETGKISKTLDSTGTKELNDNISATVKNEILLSLYQNDIEKAKKDALYVKENYDFSDDEFLDLEVFIYEVLHTLANYSSSMNIKTKASLVSSLESPELILFVLNKSSMEERMTLCQNKHSEIYSEQFSSSIGLSILEVGPEGVETCGADNVFFVTSGYDGHYIKFKTLKNTYKLYYLTDRKSGNTILMGIDILGGEYTTIKEYQNIYD